MQRKVDAVDRAVLARPGIRDMLVRDFAEALREGGSQLYEGAEEVLAALHERGYALALMSNAGEPYFQTVVEVHDLHAWSISDGFPVVTAHVVVDDRPDAAGVARDVGARLLAEHGIAHATIQPERASAQPATAQRAWWRCPSSAFSAPADASASSSRRSSPAFSISCWVLV